jgi:hypothetical protein
MKYNAEKRIKNEKFKEGSIVWLNNISLGKKIQT